MLLLNAKMTKMTYQIKPHIFFLFFMTAFSETWTGILWYSRILGFQKLRQKGGIHWDLGYSVAEEAFGLHSNRNPKSQWNHLLSQFWNPNIRETTEFLSKFHWNRHKKKNVRFPFNTSFIVIFGQKLASETKIISLIPPKKGVFFLIPV